MSIYQNNPAYGINFNRIYAINELHIPILDNIIDIPENNSPALGFFNNSLYLFDGIKWDKIANSENESDILIGDDIDYLSSIAGDANSIAIITDINRGGIFTWSSNGTPDNGIVFNGYLGFWNRLFNYNNTINADWWQDTVGSSAIVKAINYLSNVGGVIKLSNKRYVYTGYDISHAMPYDNISIIGEKAPTYNSDCTGLNGGTIIDGTFAVHANNFHIENIGIDMGLNVSDEYSIEGDGFCFSVPSTATYTPFTGLYVNNIVTLCKSPTSLYHSALFEGIEGANIHNVTACMGIHGIVIKGKDIQATNLKSYNNNDNGLILKSDLYAPYDKVHIDSFIYNNKPPLTIPYSQVTGIRGVNLVSGTLMGATIIDKITVYNCLYGITGSTTSNSSIGNLYIGEFLSDFTNIGILFDIPVFERLHINCANINNSTKGIYLNTTNIIAPFTIDSMFISNNPTPGDTAITLMNNVQLKCNNYSILNYTNELSITGAARLTYQNIDDLGTKTNNDLNIVTANKKRAIFHSNGDYEILKDTNPTLILNELNTTTKTSFYIHSGDIMLDEVGVAQRLVIKKGTGFIGISNSSPNSTLSIGGSISGNIRTVSVSDTIKDKDYVIFAAPSSNITLTLPAASNCIGRMYIIKKTINNSSTVTIVSASGNIEGQTQQVLTNQYQMITIISDGANYFLIS
jgi:hypothetical protein